MNIMTERDFLQTTQLPPEELNTFIENGLLTPIKALGNLRIFVRKHLVLSEQLRQATELGLTFEQIKPFINRNILDMEGLLQSSEIEGAAILLHEGMTTKELRGVARDEGITGFRRMTRQELIICLTDIDRRNEIIESVRERNRRETTPEVVVEEPTLVEIQLTTNPYGQFMFDIFGEEVEEVRSPETLAIVEVPLEELTPDSNDSPVTPDGQNPSEPVVYTMAQLQGLSYQDLLERALLQHTPEARKMNKSELTSYLRSPLEERASVVSMVLHRHELRQQRSVSALRDLTVEDEVENTQNLDLSEGLIETDDLPETALPDDVDTGVSEIPTTTEVPYTYEELMGMTSKQIAVIVRDHIDVLYFRRMTKAELMTCIFYPELRDEMVRHASNRYDRYRNRS